MFNVVVGRGADVGTSLIKHPGVRAISFTGSVPVGHRVRDEAVPLGKRVQLELGGHSPLVVMADADLSRASEAAYAGAFWSAGQKCTATRRIYVQDAVYDEFKAAFTSGSNTARLATRPPRPPRSARSSPSSSSATCSRRSSAAAAKGGRSFAAARASGPTAT